MSNNMAIQSVLNKYGLTVLSEFIPFSKSRNKNEKDPSLNWEIKLLCNGREILKTAYSAGCGHTPAYKSNEKDQYIKNKMIRHECESGKAVKYWRQSLNAPMGYVPSRPILPDSLDVVWSLLLDSEVLDYSNFESWAGDFGYDKDSRGEKVYNDCLKIALQLRTLGESCISELREVYQDY